MARFSDTLVNQLGAPISGAFVTVVDSFTGALAALTDDSGATLNEPLITAKDGTYYFDTSDGIYDLSFRYGGRVIGEKFSVLIGTAGVLPAGSVANFLGSSTTVAPSQAAVTAGLATKLSPVFSQLTAAASGTVVAKLKQTINVEDAPFLAVGDGAADDTAAIQAAVNSLSATGGTVRFRNKYRIAGNINVPAGVNLVGDYSCPRGRPSVGSGAVTDYSAMSSSLRVSSAATITMNGSSGVSGLVVYRYGMTFPATTASTSAAFAGTAFTVAGDDPSFDNCLIMGFNKAIYCNGVGRPRFNRLNLDNLNNIEVTSGADRAYFSECHSWPFSTICTGQTWQNLVRSGKNVYLHDFVDWAGLVNCFCYGYSRGFVFENVDSTVAMLCSADNAFDGNAGGTLNAGSIGIEVIGNCYDTELIGCQTAAQYVAGVNINLTAGYSVRMVGHTAWGGQGPGSGHGILITSGNAKLNMPAVRGCKTGVAVALAASKVGIASPVFSSITTRPVLAAAVTSNVHIIDPDFGDFTGNPVDPNIVAATVASADPLPVDAYNDDYIVTGTTSFGSIPNGYKGREIMLQFNSSLTVFNGSGSVDSIHCVGGANFAATAGAVLYARHNGVQWYAHA